MRVDPYAWLVTVPLTIALVQIWFLPIDHSVKRCWRQLQAVEAEVWYRLNRGLCRPEAASGFIHHPLVFHAMVGLFAATSILSFAAFVGVLGN